MQARLLERDGQLHLLREALTLADRGRGSVVLVSGEAGIGKTSLVRAFAAGLGAHARVLIGGCDDLVTPRTLGPFRDMAPSADGPLAEAVRPGAERDEIFAAAHRELERPSTVMIVEDVHWADDATLDVLRYLARRIAELPSLLVLTYRDDDLGAADPLPVERRARIMEESVWVLYNLYRFGQAADRARQVVGMHERIGDQAALGEALTALSRTLYMVNDPVGSEEAVTRAVALLEPLADQPHLARAYSYQAAILKLTDRLDAAIARAQQALELGERTGQPDVVSHSLNYLGYSLLDLGDLSGAGHLRRSAEIARAAHHYEYAQRAYTNLVEGLYRLGRLKDLDEPIARGLAYAREYGFASHEYNLEAHRCMLLTLRGRWDEAERGLRRLLDGDDPGVLASFGLSALGRLLARKAEGADHEPDHRQERSPLVEVQRGPGAAVGAGRGHRRPSGRPAGRRAAISPRPRWRP
jgi:tetratricopeptide (TPR) repeat protein